MSTWALWCPDEFYPGKRFLDFQAAHGFSMPLGFRCMPRNILLLMGSALLLCTSWFTSGQHRQIHWCLCVPWMRIILVPKTFAHFLPTPAKERIFYFDSTVLALHYLYYLVTDVFQVPSRITLVNLHRLIHMYSHLSVFAPSFSTSPALLRQNHQPCTFNRTCITRTSPFSVFLDPTFH